MIVFRLKSCAMVCTVLMVACTTPEPEAAQAHLQMPFFNTIYANRDGDIYYLHGGHVPARSQDDWTFWHEIVPGNRSDLIWRDYLSYEALPRLTNPEPDVIQNVNEPPWYTTWPQIRWSRSAELTQAQ